MDELFRREDEEEVLPARRGVGMERPPVVRPRPRPMEDEADDDEAFRDLVDRMMGASASSGRAAAKRRKKAPPIRRRREEDEEEI